MFLGNITAVWNFRVLCRGYVGSARKGARLKYLTDYRVNQLIENDGVKLYTSRSPKYACGIANVEIQGVDRGERSVAIS